MEIEAQVAWHETDRCLKLSFPTACAGGDVRCQVAYGVERVRREAEEAVGHRWQALLTPDGRHAITLVNDATYGFDAGGGDLRVSLLRAPAYAGHPVDEVTPIVREDRFEPREDQGPHRFRFWLNAGPAASRLAAIDQESLLRPDGIIALCVFPPGGGLPAAPGLVLTDAAVRLAALKMSEDGGAAGRAAVRDHRHRAPCRGTRAGARRVVRRRTRRLRAEDVRDRSRLGLRAPRPTSWSGTSRRDEQPTVAPGRVLMVAIGGYGYYYLQTCWNRCRQTARALRASSIREARQSGAWDQVCRLGVPVCPTMDGFLRRPAAARISPSSCRQSSGTCRRASPRFGTDPTSSATSPWAARCKRRPRSSPTRDASRRWVMIGYQWSFSTGDPGAETRHPLRRVRPPATLLDDLLLAARFRVLPPQHLGRPDAGPRNGRLGARQPGEQRDGAFSPQPAVPGRRTAGPRRLARSRWRARCSAPIRSRRRTRSPAACHHAKGSKSSSTASHVTSTPIEPRFRLEFDDGVVHFDSHAKQNRRESMLRAGRGSTARRTTPRSSASCSRRSRPPAIGTPRFVCGPEAAAAQTAVVECCTRRRRLHPSPPRPSRAVRLTAGSMCPAWRRPWRAATSAASCRAN